jgi:Tetratricopeptide repeat
MKNFLCSLSLFTAGALLPAPARAEKLHLPPEATQGLRKLYGGEPDAAIERFRQIQKQQPDHPLGYLLEANARWWKIYCEACELKWNTIDAWHRARQPDDDAYLKLADKAVQLAEARVEKNDLAEMHLYAGTGWLLRARLLGLRDDRRGTARAGVKARAHLRRAIELDPDLADANTGLGLYNYYADTLSAMAKALRFFMGIPGGNKREGIRQLEIAMSKGELTAVEARFYLAKNLRNYDHQYARAAALIEPLVAQHPQNPIFLLILGDIEAKLNRREQAANRFGAAEKATVLDEPCKAHVQQVARAALTALRAPRSSN